MSVSDADAVHTLELFAGLGGLTTRKMMGGLCVYRDGTIFAIIHPDGGIYLKARGDVITALEAEDCSQWTYTRDGKKQTGMPYWRLPEAALDDPDLACDWARRALAVL